MISLTLDTSRLHRIVAASDAAMGAVASASQRSADARITLREAREELARWRGYEDEKQHASALAAVAAAEAAMATATAEHSRVSEESRPAGQLSRRCKEYAASSGFKI